MARRGPAGIERSGKHPKNTFECVLRDDLSTRYHGHPCGIRHTLSRKPDPLTEEFGGRSFLKGTATALEMPVLPGAHRTVSAFSAPDHTEIALDERRHISRRNRDRRHRACWPLAVHP